MSRNRNVNDAIGLMRLALDLLDASSASEPAIHLQRAIDALTDAKPPRDEREAETMLASPEAQQLQERIGWCSISPATLGKGIDATFGRHLRQHRQTAGLTQADLSARTALSPGYLSRVEQGRANPTLTTMISLAEAVGSDVWDMVAPLA